MNPSQLWPGPETACVVCGLLRPGAPATVCRYCLGRVHGDCVGNPAVVSAARARDELNIGQGAFNGLKGRGSVSLKSHISGIFSAAGVTLSPYELDQRVKGTCVCSMDCALYMQHRVNPNFSPEISASVEEMFREKWGRVCGGGAEPPPTPEQLLERQQRATTADEADLVTALQAAYLQLRYEAWLRYFALERAAHAPPSWFPPARLGLSDELIEHLSHAASARGQAGRLYMCATVPVGALVAEPLADVAFRGVRPLQAGQSNNFIAEVADRVARTSVTPATTITVDLFGMIASDSETAAKAKVLGTVEAFPAVVKEEVEDAGGEAAGTSTAA